MEEDNVNNIHDNYLDDISYSVCIEKKNAIDIKKNEPLRCTLPRKSHIWIPDEAATECSNCNKMFTWFLRKHHCRLCGKIFCYECSSYRDMIPDSLLSAESKQCTWNDYLSSYLMTINLETYRVCIFCHKLIEKINSIRKIIEVFRILDLDIKELKQVGRICKTWLNATNYFLSKFREIQYKLPTDSYTKLEEKLLWLNAKYIIGHNRYTVHLLKICKSDEDINNYLEITNNKILGIRCWSLMCTKNCYRDLTSADAINVLAYTINYYKQNGIHLNNLKRLMLKYLDSNTCSDIEFKSYMPLLVYYVRYDNENIITDFLINKCLKNFKLLNCLYWEINTYPKEDEIFKNYYAKVIQLLRERMSIDNYRGNFVKLLQGNNFIKIIENIYKEKDEIKDNFNMNSELVVPLNPDHVIKKIIVNKITKYNSISNPLMVPCLTSLNKEYCVMYKKENVRKDQIIMNIIILMDNLLKKEENLDLGIVTYNIMPLSNDSGLIEIVNNCKTIYHIRESLNSDIINYIMNNNENAKVIDVRERFLKSTAAFCVITYLLGVGDRHLENIMITTDGRLFHIDYGYILGSDPVFTDPGIRITYDMVNAIGGVNSKYYEQFKEICTVVFNCLRRNIDIFMHLLLLLPKISDIRLTENDIKDQIIKRFIPGENHIDANLHIINQLERQNYTDTVKDWFHYHSKEKTVNNALTRFTSALTNMWFTTQDK